METEVQPFSPPLHHLFPFCANSRDKADTINTLLKAMLPLPHKILDQFELGV